MRGGPQKPVLEPRPLKPYCTLAKEVSSQVRSCRIYGEQNDTGAGFLRVLLFAMPILSSLIASYSFIMLSSTLRNLDADIVDK
jgi:hypothetical protein